LYGEFKSTSIRRFYIATNGCEEGGLESARVKDFLERNGLCYTSNIKMADLVIFYACGLTQEKERASHVNKEKCPSHAYYFVEKE